MIIREEGTEILEGKTVGNIITKDTKILTEFVDGYDVTTAKMRKNCLSLETYENLSVLTDLGNNLVICFKDDIPVCLFHVYEIDHVSLNGKRGMIKASGHETIHEYWFDNGEYDTEYTR